MEAKLTDALKELLKKAEGVRMTPAQEQQQRVSFVYGNTHIENERITRSLVEEVDARLSQEPKSR